MPAFFIQSVSIAFANDYLCSSVGLAVPPSTETGVALRATAGNSSWNRGLATNARFSISLATCALILAALASASATNGCGRNNSGWSSRNRGLVARARFLVSLASCSLCRAALASVSWAEGGTSSSSGCASKYRGLAATARFLSESTLSNICAKPVATLMGRATATARTDRLALVCIVFDWLRRHSRSIPPASPCPLNLHTPLPCRSTRSLLVRNSPYFVVSVPGLSLLAVPHFQRSLSSQSAFSSWFR